ncbi:Crp/Fnr family transcriptional regulator [Brumimicrobium mesophilum]|uniref:Crp/Fnr family transcriptional regulator n=1 Tax=Brumimicrobium mesophilum TaxID=392717 RepID=UPI000D1421AB|nr:Crp/Fnr family transcriptional regulator [Brumimicrobium mesophilum]
METQIFEKTYAHPLLRKPEILAIAEAHKCIKLKKGESFLEAGSDSNSYFILTKGLMRSYVISHDGEEITTNFFSNNDIVIEVSSLFQRIKSQENIEAITDCEGWEIQFDDFQKLFHSMEGFVEWGRAWMSGILFEMKQRSIFMITEDATTRYQNLLVEKPSVIKHTPLKYIASYLGITNSSLSRIRKEI